MSTTTLLQVPTDTHTLDTIHSSVGFAVRHGGISTFRTTFHRFDAQLADGVLTGTAQADSIDIDLPDFKAHVLGPDFFNVETTPTITFRSREIRLAQDGTAEVDGDLTIRGITKPLVARGTHVAGAGMDGSERIGLELTATIDRRGYDLNWNAPLPKGGDVLAWDVTLEVHLELVKAS